MDLDGPRICGDEELSCCHRIVSAGSGCVQFVLVNICGWLLYILDINRKDYRAWYGLGQAYELLSMHQYALHYYQRATALR